MAQVMTRVQILRQGTSTVLTDGGGVLSCKADGSIEIVPAGSTGPAEQVMINGALCTYAPVDGKIYNFPFAGQIPNFTGWSGIYLTAL